MTYSKSPQIVLWDSSRIMKPVGSVTMLPCKQLPVNRATAVRTRSSLKNQVDDPRSLRRPVMVLRSETCKAFMLLVHTHHRTRSIRGRKQLPLIRLHLLFQYLDSGFLLQVFEDQCKGIVCYRDESGEIICEGYDEGPRLRRKIPRTAYSCEAR